MRCGVCHCCRRARQHETVASNPNHRNHWNPNRIVLRVPAGERRVNVACGEEGVLPPAEPVGTMRHFRCAAGAPTATWVDMRTEKGEYVEKQKGVAWMRVEGAWVGRRRDSFRRLTPWCPSPQAASRASQKAVAAVKHGKVHMHAMRAVGNLPRLAPRSKVRLRNAVDFLDGSGCHILRGPKGQGAKGARLCEGEWDRNSFTRRVAAGGKVAGSSGRAGDGGLHRHRSQRTQRWLLGGGSSGCRSVRSCARRWWEGLFEH